MNISNKLNNITDEKQIDDLLKNAKQLLEKMQNIENKENNNVLDLQYQKNSEQNKSLQFSRPYNVNIPKNLSKDHTKLFNTSSETEILEVNTKTCKVTKLKRD